MTTKFNILKTAASSIINIHKQVARKDAVRVNDVNDIPEFLKEAIRGVNNELELDCAEGTQHCPRGSVIGYEASKNTSSGWNCWCIGNAAINLEEIDGVFYTKPTVLQAMPVSEEFPEFLKGADISHNADGSWSIKTDWGVSTGFPGESYWVLYGIKADGTLDANILTKTEESYKKFIVCDDDGNDIGFLCEIDPA